VEEAFDEAWEDRAIMAEASMSRVTVKKMKVAAARRPFGWGGCECGVSMDVTSSGSLTVDRVW